MKRKVIDWSAYHGPIPGYGDCRPDGAYACLIPEKCVISFQNGALGEAALPGGENILYLRIPDNDGRVAGLGHLSNRNLEWHVNHWEPKGPTYGPNAVIYDAQHRYIEIGSVAEYQATGGWRSVNAQGQLVSCESTYADPARGLWAYSEWSDLAIGQGGDAIGEGAVVLFKGEPLRRLDPRPANPDGSLPPYPFHARFMYSRRAGDLFAITLVDSDARKTYFLWPTLAELRALPFVGAVPPITIPPVEPPIPVEPPVSELPDPSAFFAVLKAERDKYPAIVTQNEMGRILNDTAFKFPDCGMHKKVGQALQPITNIPIDSDIIRYHPAGDPFGWYSDVLGATGAGLATPQAPSWTRGNDDRNSFVKPVATGPDVPPVEPPTGNTHRYVGGGNDSGECDQCHQPRVSDIHRVPEGKVPHSAFVGEDGKGDCDLCFQPVDAPIHHGTVPPVDPPTGDLAARVVALEAAVDAINRQLERVSQAWE